LAAVLKYLDALEADKATEAVLEGRDYPFILSEPYRWSAWAAPKMSGQGADGKIDHNAALTGDDLKAFVNAKLFPYLAGFKQRASGPQTIEYKIGEVFSEITNKIQSGYNLRDVIDRIDELRFGSQAQKHELSHLYEAKIKNMGNAGRNGGEYYTPRPLIRAMIDVVQPQIGERIYDAACGSAGFLCEAFAYLSPKATKADDLETLQKRTFYGKEKKSLAYVIGIMNMILHGIEAPHIVHTNTLGENINDIQARDRFDVILANPPFGDKERKEVQQNFPIKTGETAFLRMQHFIKSLRRGAVLHQRRAHPPDLVLPTRPRPQHGQNQPAQRRGFGGVCATAKDLGRLAQKLERAPHPREPGHVRPVGEKPERRRRSGAPQPSGHPG
jgi:type I restriction enzyme M protein